MIVKIIATSTDYTNINQDTFNNNNVNKIKNPSTGIVIVSLVMFMISSIVYKNIINENTDNSTNNNATNIINDYDTNDNIINKHPTNESTTDTTTTNRSLALLFNNLISCLIGRYKNQNNQLINNDKQDILLIISLSALIYLYHVFLIDIRLIYTKLHLYIIPNESFAFKNVIIMIIKVILFIYLIYSAIIINFINSIKLRYDHMAYGTEQTRIIQQLKQRYTDDITNLLSEHIITTNPTEAANALYFQLRQLERKYQFQKTELNVSNKKIKRLDDQITNNQLEQQYTKELQEFLSQIPTESLTKKALVKLTELLENSNEKVSRLEKTIKGLEASMDELKNKMEKTTKSETKLAESNSTLKSEIQTLKDELASVTAQYKSGNKKI